MQCITLAKDSTLISIFSHAHPPSLAHPLDSIYKYDFHKSNYVGLGDIISTSTTTLQQNIGEPLIYSGISIFNSSPSTTVLSYNGVQIQDMISGPGDVYGMSPETINKVSIFTGLDASILGGSSGAYIYLQENMYSASKPFSRIWYIQGGYDLIGSEGLLTQNIDSNTNIHASYRRLSSSGMLRNSGADIWNTRIGARHIFSPTVHGTLQWLFSNQGAYHNGGIYGKYDNPITANVLYDNYFDRSYTHTIQSTVTIDNLINKNSSIVFNAYLGNSILETRGINPYTFYDTSRIEFSPEFRTGFNSRIELPTFISQLSLMSELGIEYSNYNYLNNLIDQTFRTYAYVYASYLISDSDILKVGVRNSTQKQNDLNYGISYVKNIDKVWNIQVDYSKTYTINPIQYRYIDTTTEYTQLAFAKVAYTTPHVSMSIQPFYRATLNPMLLTMIFDTASIIPSLSELKPIDNPNFTTIGITTAAQVQYGGFSVHTMFSYSKQYEGFTIAPRFFMQINSQYELNIGSSTLSFGGTVRLIEGPTTLRYVPYLNIMAHDGYTTNTDLQWNGLDLHASAILGNARIRASLLNLFSTQFMNVSGYPIQDNIIRLSLNWSFFD
ncbi:hypothetical protein EBV26_08175 [bacterium]|nr:hypothetical protein [bacterium]